MNLAAEMGGMFIVPDITVRASLQIINIGGTRQTGYRSPEFRGRLRASASLFTFIHGHACFDCENVHMKRSRDRIRKDHLGYEPYIKILVV